ncbi:MAG: DUF2721 domain-containing protein [Deltaproteobacteria bacterium]|nr:DUF2721 domain-containing protein [Deltaproteobacteria bacterium]
MPGVALETTALSLLTVMITPAILIVATASLITCSLMRLARVVDRVRALSQIAEDIRVGKCTDHPGERRKELGAEFLLYQRRGRLILITLNLQYGTVGFFVATSVAVALDFLLGSPWPFLPVGFCIAGILLLLGSSLLLMVENRLALMAMQREIEFVHLLEEAIFKE